MIIGQLDAGAYATGLAVTMVFTVLNTLVNIFLLALVIARRL
jgi:hypothetical protein